MFKVDTDTFAAAVKLAARLAKEEPAQPEMNMVLLELDGGTLTVTGTNRNSRHALKVPIVTDETIPVSVCVPAKRLADIASALPEDVTTLNIIEEDCVLKYRNGRSKGSIKGMNGDGYPLWYMTGNEPAGVVDGAMLGEALSLMKEYASERDARPVFTGVMVEFSQDAYIVRALDGFRFCQSTIDANIPGVLVGKKLLIPASELDFAKMMDGEIEVSISANGSYVNFKASGWQYTVITLNAQHVAIEEFDRYTFNSSMEFEPEVFLPAYKAVAPSALQTNVIKFTIGDTDDDGWEKMHIESGQTEEGESESWFPVEIDSKTIVTEGEYLFALNTIFLKSFSKQVTNISSVTMEWDASNTPVRFSYSRDIAEVVTIMFPFVNKSVSGE